MPLFRSWLIYLRIGNGGLPAHVCQQTYNYYQTYQGRIDGDRRIFGDYFGIPGRCQHLDAVEEYMRNNGGPKTTAVPKHRAQQDAQEHPGEESGELKMDG